MSDKPDDFSKGGAYIKFHGFIDINEIRAKYNLPPIQFLRRTFLPNRKFYGDYIKHNVPGKLLMYLFWGIVFSLLLAWPIVSVLGY